MTVFLVLDRFNRIRGFPYVDRRLAEEGLKEAELLWNSHDEGNPHRIVPFVPESTKVVEA